MEEKELIQKNNSNAREKTGRTNDYGESLILAQDERWRRA